MENETERFIRINGRPIPELFDIQMGLFNRETGLYHYKNMKKKKFIYFGRRDDIFFKSHREKGSVRFENILQMLLWDFEVYIDGSVTEDTRPFLHLGGRIYEFERSTTDGIFRLPIFLNIPGVVWHGPVTVTVENVPDSVSTDNIFVSAKTAYCLNLQLYCLAVDGPLGISKSINGLFCLCEQRKP